jgi:hypothetical protein
MQISRTCGAIGVAAVLALTGTANAGSLFGTINNQYIFGRDFNIDIYRVSTDLSSQGLTPASGRVEPEGMTFYNGTLYVGSDGSTSEANGYLAAYAGGNLAAAPSAQRFTVTVGSNTAAYGPEGLTVNTRGTGYGSFSGSAPKFTAIDSVISPVSSRVWGAMNSATGTVDNALVSGSFNFDDIAYVPGASAAEDRFAVIDASGAPAIRYYSADNTPVDQGVVPAFNLPANSKGMTFLSAADANLFTPLATTDALLISSGASSPNFVGVNVLSLYSLDGTLIARSFVNAALGTIGNGEIESLAWDSEGKRLFLGYENGASSQIGVFTVPAPSAGLLLGASALAGLARRRR